MKVDFLLLLLFTNQHKQAVQQNEKRNREFAYFHFNFLRCLD